MGFWKLTNRPQWHSSTNKATASNLSQMVPGVDQTLKYISLWGEFPFISPLLPLFLFQVSCVTKLLQWLVKCLVCFQMQGTQFLPPFQCVPYLFAVLTNFCGVKQVTIGQFHAAKWTSLDTRWDRHVGLGSNIPLFLLSTSRNSSHLLRVRFQWHHLP